MSNLKLSDFVEKELSGLSPIQTIMKMAEERNIKKMGLDPNKVISFGGGWCNHRAPEEMRNIYEKISKNKDLFQKSGRYSSILGNYKTREQISRFENEIFKIKEISPKNIIIGQSSTQLFHDILRVICNPKDKICLLDPTYANYINAVKCAIPDSKMIFLPALNKENWTYLKQPQKTLDELQEKCKQGAKTLIIPVPDNPTSQIPDDKFLESAYQIIRENNGYLIIDHAYKPLWFDEMPKSFSWSPNDKSHLITIHSNSKWLSSLGRRLGWIEADGEIIKGCEKLNESVLLSPDTLHSMATSEFLKKTLDEKTLKPYIDETRKLYQKTAEILIKTIEKEIQWPTLKPKGGLYTICPTPNKEPPIHFVEKILKNTGVLLIPGNGFGPSMNQAIRISYGPLCYEHEKIKEGIERIADFLS